MITMNLFAQLHGEHYQMAALKMEKEWGFDFVHSSEEKQKRGYCGIKVDITGGL